MMMRVLTIFLSVILVFIVSSCGIIKDSFTYKNKTKELIEALMNEDYDKVFDCFALDSAQSENIDRAKLKSNLRNFRQQLCVEPQYTQTGGQLPGALLYAQLGA